MGKPYITREGYDLLHQELDYLWLEKRPDVTQKVSWAASLGDRSENADYQYINTISVYWHKLTGVFAICAAA